MERWADAPLGSSLQSGSLSRVEMWPTRQNTCGLIASKTTLQCHVV